MSKPSKAEHKAPEAPGESCKTTELGTLISNFLKGGEDYFRWHQLEVMASVFAGTKREQYGSMEVAVKFDADVVERVWNYHNLRMDAMVTLRDCGEKLAPLLDAHGHYRAADFVRRVVYRAAGGGGGPTAVQKIWEDTRVSLLPLATATTVPTGAESKPSHLPPEHEKWQHKDRTFFDAIVALQDQSKTTTKERVLSRAGHATGADGKRLALLKRKGFLENHGKGYTITNTGKAYKEFLDAREPF